MRRRNYFILYLIFLYFLGKKEIKVDLSRFQTEIKMIEFKKFKETKTKIKKENKTKTKIKV